MVRGNMLRRKLLRDMWRSKLQFVSMLLLCALGTWVFTGLDAAWRMLDRTIETYYEEQNLADFWVQLPGADREALRRLERLPGVARVQMRVNVEMDTDLSSEATLQVLGYDGEAAINAPLLREGEAQATFDMLSNLDVDTARMDVTAQTFEALRGLTDWDAKRRAVVGVMHRAMDAFAGALDEASILLQGTNYSDITIGHVPETAGGRLRTVLPLRELFKDEVRRVAEQLGLPAEVARRQPFPAAGLAMRIAGETTPERVRMLRAADAVFAAEIREAGQERRLTRFYPTLASGAPFGWAGEVVTLHAAHASDSRMVPARLPYDLMERVAGRIVREVPGVSRVLYDLTPGGAPAERA